MRALPVKSAEGQGHGVVVSGFFVIDWRDGSVRMDAKAWSMSGMSDGYSLNDPEG
jgi:hypothetical protein